MTKKTQRKPAQPAKEDPPKKDTTVTIRLNEDDKSAATVACMNARTNLLDLAIALEAE